MIIDTFTNTEIISKRWFCQDCHWAKVWLKTIDTLKKRRDFEALANKHTC